MHRQLQLGGGGSCRPCTERCGALLLLGITNSRSQCITCICLLPKLWS